MLTCSRERSFRSLS